MKCLLLASPLMTTHTRALMSDYSSQLILTVFDLQHFWITKWSLALFPGHGVRVEHETQEGEVNHGWDRGKVGASSCRSQGFALRTSVPIVAIQILGRKEAK